MCPCFVARDSKELDADAVDFAGFYRFLGGIYCYCGFVESLYNNLKLADGQFESAKIKV